MMIGEWQDLKAVGEEGGERGMELSNYIHMLCEM